MRSRHHYILASLLAATLGMLSSLVLMATPIDNTRKQLLENQRNIIHLRKEKRLFEKELQQTIEQHKDDNNPSSLQAEINDLRDSIAVADTLISNITAFVTQQRLLLSTLERGSPPTALDTALNKALNSNLPELAKTLANNPAARKEIGRLRELLKQQARLGGNISSNSDSAAYAAEQQLAEEEFLRLLSLFSSGSDDEAEDKPINISGTTNNTPFTEEAILSYLGHDQFHMETTVYAGKMTFTVDGKPWQLNISKEEDQTTYVIIYDMANQSLPRLVMFNKSLLLE